MQLSKPKLHKILPINPLNTNEERDREKER
jgi:hypothetical protein